MDSVQSQNTYDFLLVIGGGTGWTSGFLLCEALLFFQNSPWIKNLNISLETLKNGIAQTKDVHKTCSLVRLCPFHWQPCLVDYPGDTEPGSPFQDVQVGRLGSVAVILEDPRGLDLGLPGVLQVSWETPSVAAKVFRFPAPWLSTWNLWCSSLQNCNSWGCARQAASGSEWCRALLRAGSQCLGFSECLSYLKCFEQKILGLKSWHFLTKCYFSIALVQCVM